MSLLLLLFLLAPQDTTLLDSTLQPQQTYISADTSTVLTSSTTSNSGEFMFSTVLSIISLAVSFLALWVSWIVYKRRVNIEKPRFYTLSGADKGFKIVLLDLSIGKNLHIENVFIKERYLQKRFHFGRLKFPVPFYYKYNKIDRTVVGSIRPGDPPQVSINAKYDRYINLNGYKIKVITNYGKVIHKTNSLFRNGSADLSKALKQGRL